MCQLIIVHIIIVRAKNQSSNPLLLLVICTTITMILMLVHRYQFNKNTLFNNKHNENISLHFCYFVVVVCAIIFEKAQSHISTGLASFPTRTANYLSLN